MNRLRIADRPRTSHDRRPRAAFQRKLTLVGVLMTCAGLPALGQGSMMAVTARPANDPTMPMTRESDVKLAARRCASTLDAKQVDYDSPGDGAVWARGATYKAGFTTEGAIYAPFLGWQAPRCFPVTFRVEHVSVGGIDLAFDAGVAASRSADRVSYERGAFTEVYDLEPSSIEQSFVLTRASARGEIVVRLSTETDLEAREIAAGLEFATELGSVRYGRATARDASGASVVAPSTLTATGIEIRVPASFVATARFPLTIDPVLSTFAVDSSTLNDFSADVAYDAGTDRWLCVYEEVFSATDHDIRWRMLSSTGASLGTGLVESTLSQYWANPAVANNDLANRFLVVAQVGLPGSGPRKIHGRLINPSTLSTQGSSFQISGTNQSDTDMFNPDVGGTSSSFWCVVWERTFSSSDSDILYRLVDQFGVPANVDHLGLDTSSGTIDTEPSISKSNDGGFWNVVWQRESSQGHGIEDIRASRITWNGLLDGPSFSIDSSSANTARPSASTCLHGTNRWMVAFERDFNSNFDVMLTALDGSTVLDTVDLSVLEVHDGSSQINALENQLHPDIDSDGTAFAVAYSENVPPSQPNTNIFVATVALTGDKIHLSEGHRLLANSPTSERLPAIASREGAGGAGQRYMVVWEDAATSTNGNIEGGLYDGSLYTTFCNPNGGGDAVCPCGNDPTSFGRGCNNSANTGGAMLTLTGVASLSSDTLVLSATEVKPNALSVFSQGAAVLAASIPFGQGARCVGGSIKRLFTKTATGGTASAPQSGDSSVHTRSAALGDTILAGTTRGYYMYYRDPVVLGGCSAASTFNTTQSMQAIWIP